MPTGYEARQGGRDSFASEGLNPVQTTTGASASSRGAQQVGGESISGTEGGMATDAGPVAAGLGQFFETFMEPVVKRKQQAQFFKGFTEAQSGRALNELTDNGSPLTQIFGPSGFSQGAQYYAAQTNINKWTTEALGDTDALMRMNPEELSKYMADTSTGMMTGDPYADQQIQIGLLEAQGPVIQTITKARFEWQQSTAVEGMSQAMGSAAGALQTVAVANARLGEQGDPEATQATRQRFLGLMQRPDGLTEENYQKGLYGFMRNSMANGQFYAVEAMMEAGVDDIFTDDQQEKLWAAYDRYGTKQVNLAAGDPAIQQAIAELDWDSKTERVSAAEAMGRMGKINDQVRAITGIQRDYFDPEDIRAGAGNVMDTIIARQRREEARQFQLEDREAARQDRADEKADKAAEEAAAVMGAWATGDINAAIAGGAGKSTEFNTVAMEEYSQGNLGGITRAYKQSGWSSTGVASQVQAMARNGIGEKYTESTRQAYETWQTFTKANPTMAKTYFGEYDLAFTNFDRMVRGGTSKEAAFKTAFIATNYAVQAVPPERRKEFTAELDSIVGSQSSSWYNPMSWGNYTLTDTSQSALASVIGDEFARLAQHSDRPTPELAQQAYTLAVNNGRWEQYGELGWANAQPGTPLAAALGVKPKDAAEVIPGVIREALGTIGVSGFEGVKVYRTGTSALVEVLRDGVTQWVAVAGADFKEAADKRVQGIRDGVYDDSAKYRWTIARTANQNHARRRVAGETPYQRVTRANDEMRAWARANPVSKYDRTPPKPQVTPAQQGAASTATNIIY